MAPERPVLIIGAGVVGLTLAHGLANAGVPFEIFERDPSPVSRSQGWAITFHWCLPFLKTLLTPETLALVGDAQVDPEVAKNDTGNFLFLNLKTLETKFKIPPNERRRVERQKFRQALLDDPRIGGKVQWGKRLANVQLLDDGDVKAVFQDGSHVEGHVLVGAEGSNSTTRKILAPDAHELHPVDVKLIGASVDMTPEQAQPLRDIDPLLFQGCHPDTNSFLWVSTLATPEISDAGMYKMQVILSWPAPFGSQLPDDLPAGMKERARVFHPTLRNAVNLVTTAQEIPIQDWPCLPWSSNDGATTLIGDAAHAMTMYRGEAANHGILDAYHLTKGLVEVYNDRKARDAVIEAYEAEMRDRTAVAVGWSREACVGAHNWDTPNANSAVLRRRAVRESEK